MKGYDWLMSQNWIEWFRTQSIRGSVRNTFNTTESSYRTYGPFGSLRADTPDELWQPRRDEYQSLNLERY